MKVHEVTMPQHEQVQAPRMRTIRYEMTADDRGDALFRTRDSADDWVVLLDGKGINHGAVTKIDLGYHTAEMIERDDLGREGGATT